MSKTRDFLGPYRLARLIRAGTTSEVWEAIEEHEQKRYALKILRRNSRDKADIASLKHEFNVAQAMNSPRIVKMYEYRTENDTPFLVMELFSELNMKQALRRGPDSLAFMLKTIIEQAAEGLYYMHTKNWIHRDVKPDNFLVSRDGVTKLIDFTIAEAKKTGLGKLFHRRGSTTQGTRSYMAPEQIRGKVCDERTDVYSFGCVCYEMATGKPPFTGQTPSDLLSKHLSGSIPSAVAQNNNVTKEFAELIKRMMAKKPDQRPPSMWEFLKEFRSMETFRKRPKPPEVSVFDDMPGVRGADDMMKKGGGTVSGGPGLEFEYAINEVEERIATLQRETDRSEDDEQELRRLRLELVQRLKEVYSSLDAWQTVQVARHKNRPYTGDYLKLAFEEFVELHGDKHFGDDRAMLSGFAKLDRFKVMVLGHQKGRTYKERAACHFGCAHPEGYRKAMIKMRLAEKYRLPLICFIDTPGAYPGVGAEERGQAQVIAESMFMMSRLKTPVICIVIGEGGSGGALGIGVGDRVAVLEHAYYSVISPEGCAGILWKSHEHAPKAAAALRFTSKDLVRLGVVDDVIQEPLGGAHRDHRQMAMRLKTYLSRTLTELETIPTDQLIESRYNKYRAMGKLDELAGGELETA